jgi:hypothetical protein
MDENLHSHSTTFHLFGAKVVKLFSSSLLLQIGKLEHSPKLYFHWQIFKAKLPATVTRDSHYYSCLAHIEQNDTNRNDLNGTACFKKYKQLFEYQHLFLLRDIWWSKF